MGCLVMGWIFLAESEQGPVLTLHNVTVEVNEEVDAWNFVTECSDPKASVYFVEEPKFHIPGGQEVTIEAMDEEGRSTIRKAMLKVSILKHNLKLEADGEPMALEDILVSGINPAEVSFKNKPVKLQHVNKIDVRVIYQDVEYEASVRVVDTTVPKVALKDKIFAYQNHEFLPESAAASIVDATDVTVTTKGQLDVATLGSYPITFVFTDEGGNAVEFTKEVQVIEDKVPPVLQGAENREFYIGDTVAYMDGVSAKDAVDGVCNVVVDNSQVDMEREGVYPVIYKAVDSSGNEVTKTVQFTLLKRAATSEKLNAAADKLLSEITSDTMSKSQKAYEIYNYVYSHMTYTGTSDKSNWENEAYRGLFDWKGDCFTYYAVCRILLERCEIDVMTVTRVGGEAEHYWLRVNTGTGWYHFDATRRKVYFDGFMARDEDVDAYTAQVGGNYYSYDKSKYPASPTEKYQIQ